MAVWCHDNKLSLNVSKRKELIMDYRKRKLNRPPLVFYNCLHTKSGTCHVRRMKATKAQLGMRTFLFIYLKNEH